MNLRKYEREQKKADLGDKKISSRILGEPKQTRKGPNDNTTNYKFILYDYTSQSQDENERLKVVKAVLYDDMKVGVGVKRDKE